VLFQDFFESTFRSLPMVGVDFLITGAILWSAGRARPGDRPEPSLGGAIGIGFAQAFAILPGISRSGSTVTAGIWTRVDPVRAAEFSFLMAMPAIAGAAILHIPDLSRETMVVGAGPLALSFVTALVCGVLAIRLLVRLLARRAFHRFAPYCFLLGTVTIVWAVLRA
jgi:undecaprenyl-diphosphatase